GAKATLVTDPVNAVKAIGNCMIQLLIVEPMTASGCRIASGPQPRSYVRQRRPAKPYCSWIVVLDPFANGSSAGGSSSGAPAKNPATPRPGNSGVGASLQSNRSTA